jgi:hypothetical protein
MVPLPSQCWLSLQRPSLSVGPGRREDPFFARLKIFVKDVSALVQVAAMRLLWKHNFYQNAAREHS